ncbi:MAG: hypothetical protein WBA67_06730, partial [Jannaschia sp.]
MPTDPTPHDDPRDRAAPPDAEHLGRLLQAVIGEEMDRSPAVRALAVELASWVLHRAGVGAADPESRSQPTPSAPPGSSTMLASPDPQPQPPRRATPAPAAISGPVSRVPLVIGGSSVEVAVRGDGASIQA